MKAKFWGVRGSMPTARAEVMGVGGNTSCVQVISKQNDLIILDAGTGIAHLSKALTRQKQAHPLRIHLLLTHTHWDHIQGLPFFNLLNHPDNHVTIYGCDKPDKSLKSILHQQMNFEYFPVGLDEIQAQLDFKIIEADSQFSIGEIQIRTAAFNHPGGVLGYRIQEDEEVLVYATDMEYTHETLDPHLIQFVQDADLLIFDAQYTPDEYKEKQGWGHSNYELATHLANQAKVKQLYLFSHDPDHDDLDLYDIEKQAQQAFAQTYLAKEGVEAQVGHPLALK